MFSSYRVRIAIGVACLMAALAPVPGWAQAPDGAPVTDISGEWAFVVNEDFTHRVPGAELGDFTGLPLNTAALQKAQSWDASVLAQPERQAQPHPAQYSMRGPGPSLRILRILDPITQNLVAYTISGGFGRADRVIWMDGRPHPSDYSEHTWDGFSTGRWEKGQLVVTTTHMKQGVIQRNGAATSPYGVMTEHWFRHGTMLTLFWSVDDPIFLEEPMVRTHNWAWNPNATIRADNPNESVDELGNRPLGWVPAYPLGTKHTEFAEMHNLPFKATLGGRDSLYPEFMDKVKQFAQEEVDAKAKADPAATKAPARK